MGCATASDLMHFQIMNLGTLFPSGDASRLLTWSADRTARVMKLPLSKYCGEGTDLIGHNAAVLSACWSHDGTMVLTASADRTAMMWNAAWAQPLLKFSHEHHQVWAEKSIVYYKVAQ